jgi:hypothetical protein
VSIDGAPYDVRERVRWKLGLLFVALFVVPVAIQQWPWKFLPLRWQYPFDIRRGERIVEMIDRFRAVNGRLPTSEELASALPMGDWPCSDCYNPSGESYFLLVTGGFEYRIWYDPQTREFRRSP